MTSPINQTTLSNIDKMLYLLHPKHRDGDCLKVIAARQTLEAEINKARASVGDLAMKHAERADYFKPDTLVVMAETLDWASKLTPTSEKEGTE